MKRLLLILISLSWIAFFTEETRACSCIESDVPVCAAYWRADAVFAGELMDITLAREGSRDGPPSATLHFIVEQPFRGVAAGRIEVGTLHGTSCDMTFVKGMRYLIYASRGQDKQLFAGPCTRTTELKHADEDLNYIRTLKQQGAKETILGRLLRGRYEPLPGLKVTVLSGDKSWESKTDEKGDFSVTVPGPGNYTVRAFFPFAAIIMAHYENESGKIAATDTLTTFEYEVQVGKNECQYRQLETFKTDLHATAEVSGNVLTASGRPVNPGYVYLVNAADSDDSVSKKIEADGSFKFEGVAVGEYYLVLNPWNQAPDEDDPPYPRTYYPNVLDATAATKIVVVEGAKLENLTLRVGQRWKERVVSGKVAWEDGRPVQDAHISLYDGDRYVRMIKVDEKGRFNFKVYGEFRYAIHAEVWGQIRGKSERVPITNEKSTGLTLVLKRID